MIRRSHRKSRQGCAECKQSHKKCDETRPRCVQCTTAKKQCSYTRNVHSQSPKDRNFVILTTPDDFNESRSSHPSIASNTASSSPRPIPTPPPSRAEPHVNLLHLELFQNVVSNQMNLALDEASKEQWRATMVRYTFLYPYLMYEALAISAFHLSIMHPTKADIYIPESTTLQAQALSLFNSSDLTGTQDNINAAFLFSALLGLHFFCDTFSTPCPDLSTFLDRLVQSIRLLRGVRTMVGDSWESIKTSDIRHLIQVIDGPVVDRDDEVTHALEDLRTNFSQSRTLSAFESKVYCEAITGLISAYNTNLTESSADTRLSSKMVMDWPITISAEYTELLNERKPEALVVMGYFSILLHMRRSFWAVGDAGRFLLAAIEEYLGKGWAEWLTVPKGMVLPL